MTVYKPTNAGWGAAQPKPKKKQKVMKGHPLGFKTRREDVSTQRGQSVHFLDGLGYYAAKKGTGKSFGTPTNPYGTLGPSPGTVDRVDNGGGGTKSGSSNPAPAGDKAAAQAAATAASAPSTADLISKYSIERAKILQGMAPQIAGFYTDASQHLQDIGNPQIAGIRDNLYEAGGGKAAEFNSQIDPRILASYAPDATANAAQYLGVQLPADTLQKQGANFGAAAAFAPGAALQEGQYALVKAVEAAKVANAEAAKVSASVSKMLGYVADAYGNPITGKNGKVIKLPKAELTPYQQAQLEMSGKRLDTQIATTNARLDQAERFHKDGINFKTAKAKSDYEIAVAKGKLPNAALSAKFGYIVDSNGNAIPNSKGRHIPVAKTAAAVKTRSATQSQAIDRQIQAWYTGNTKVETRRNPDTGELEAVPTPRQGGKLNYQVALRRLMKTYKLKLKDAQDMLDTYYKLPDDYNDLKGKTPQQIRQITRGRPLIDYQDRQYLIKHYKIPASLVGHALFDISAYMQVMALYHKKGGK